MDLNHLWQQVQELSAILAQNRESTAGLVRRADEIRVCHVLIQNRGEARSPLILIERYLLTIVLVHKSRTNLGEALPHLRESNGEANGQWI